MARSEKDVLPEEEADEEEGEEDEESEEEEDGDEDDEEDDSDASELDLTLDEDGRIPGGIAEAPCPPRLDYSFRSFGEALDASWLPPLIKDCKIAFTARTQEGGAAYSAGETYFIPAASQPRCALEGLAQSVFQLHTSHLSPGQDYDAERSGAEWWTLVMQGQDDVGFHWDRDYELEGGSGVLVHPHIASVTYMAAVGGCTLVTDHVSPTSSDESLEGVVRHLLVARPAGGKHMSFDGRLLHGAPAEANVWEVPNSDPEAPPRVTFLVNIWLNHTPLSAGLLPEATLKQLSSLHPAQLGSAGHLARWAASEVPCPTLTSTGVDTTQVDWRFQAGSPHALRLPYPTKQLQALQLAPGACVIVQYKDGEAAVVKCAPMAKKRKR